MAKARRDVFRSGPRVSRLAYLGAPTAIRARSHPATWPWIAPWTSCWLKLPFRHTQRMVAAFDHIKLGRWFELGDDRAQLLWSSEGVARALNEQHPRIYVG